MGTLIFTEESEHVALVCIVYNDAAYGAEVHHIGDGEMNVDMLSVVFPETDFAAIGRRIGADGITVRTVEDLDAVTQWHESNPSGPLVIDAKITSDGGSCWLSEAFMGSRNTLVVGLSFLFAVIAAPTSVCSWNNPAV